MFNHRRSAARAGLAVICLTMSACWIPENFETKVTINNDCSYRFIYDGILTFAPALGAAAEGKLSPADEEEFKKKAAEIRNEAGFQRVEYQGKGRYKVYCDRTMPAGQSLSFIAPDEKKCLLWNPAPRTRWW
jgi:hypothetical protein